MKNNKKIKKNNRTKLKLCKSDYRLIKEIIKTIKKSPFIYKHFNNTYRTQLYTLDEILPLIFNILKYGYPWRHIEDLNTNISWSTVHKAFQKLTKFGVFESTYKELLHKYIKKTPGKKLKILMTDTTTIYNKYNSDTAKINKYYKNKNVIKISVICDAIGVPISVEIYSGNKNDANIFLSQLNNDVLINKIIYDKYKKYLLGDKGYDSISIRNKLKDQNIIPIIDYNKRNTKNKTKIKKLTVDEKEIYRKRLIVEHLFSKNKNAI